MATTLDTPTLTPTIEIDEVHRFSLEEYHRLIDAGAIDEDLRVELIEGVIVDMVRKSREHEGALIWLNRWLITALDPARFEVGVQSPLTLERSEPEPDLIVVPTDAPRPYHPSTAALVIEVAVSSQRRDLRQKPRLYARAGVPEYWVVNLNADEVVVHRDPADAGFQTVISIPEPGGVQAQSLPLPRLEVAELLAAAYRR